MKLLPVCQRLLSAGGLLSLLLAAFCCGGDHGDVEVVGFTHCADCPHTDIKTGQLYSGLRVVVECKSGDGRLRKRGTSNVNKEGKFRVTIPRKAIEEEEDCFAKLYSAKGVPCSTRSNGRETKLSFKSEANGKQILGLVGKLEFSRIECASAFFWHFHKHPLLPKFPPFLWTPTENPPSPPPPDEYVSPSYGRTPPPAPLYENHPPPPPEDISPAYELTPPPPPEDLSPAYEQTPPPPAQDISPAYEQTPPPPAQDISPAYEQTPPPPAQDRSPRHGQTSPPSPLYKKSLPPPPPPLPPPPPPEYGQTPSLPPPPPKDLSPTYGRTIPPPLLRKKSLPPPPLAAPSPVHNKLVPPTSPVVHKPVVASPSPPPVYHSPVPKFKKPLPPPPKLKNLAPPPYLEPSPSPLPAVKSAPPASKSLPKVSIAPPANKKHLIPKAPPIPLLPPVPTIPRKFFNRPKTGHETPVPSSSSHA